MKTVSNGATSIDLSPSVVLSRDVSNDVSLEVFGNPLVTPQGTRFNGKDDGILCHELPILSSRLSQSSLSFTVEARIKPDSGGPWEQRFFHIQDSLSDDRFLLELRMFPGGMWYADTFFQSGGRHVIIQLPQKIHPGNIWHNYRVEYDGEYLRQIINDELEEQVLFPGATLPTQGSYSLGMRANKTFPFCGEIASLILSGGVEV